MEWPKCPLDRPKQSSSVFYRSTDCKLKKGLFGKDSPLRDHSMFNYMRLETLQSSGPAKRGIKISGRHSGWCRVSFWAPGTKIQTQSGVFSHSKATIIVHYYCPCGVIWSWKMSHKNSSKLFVSLLFLLLPSFYFLALFFSVGAFLSLSSLQMVLWCWIHQVCKLPPSSDTSLAESTGSPAGIVRVKLKNNKACQCRFSSPNAWHQWVRKKTAVALIFPFLQLAWTWQSIHSSPPFSHSVFVRTRGWPWSWSGGWGGRDRSRMAKGIILFRIEQVLLLGLNLNLSGLH